MEEKKQWSTIQTEEVKTERGAIIKVSKIKEESSGFEALSIQKGRNNVVVPWLQKQEVVDAINKVV